MYSNITKAIILALILASASKVSFAKSTTENLTKEQYCLATALYYEAENDNLFGKTGVAKVIFNRIEHKKYPKSVCEVVHESKRVKGRRICQFSWYCSKRKINKHGTSWADAKYLSRSILNKKIKLPNFHKNVLFFKSKKCKNTFGKFLKVTLASRSDKIKFYRLKEA